MSATARQVERAVGLVIAGAMRDVDNGTGLSFTDIMFAVSRELKDWLEAEEEIGRMVTAEMVSFFGGEVAWESRVAPPAPATDADD